MMLTTEDCVGRKLMRLLLKAKKHQDVPLYIVLTEREYGSLRQSRHAESLHSCNMLAWRKPTAEDIYEKREFPTRRKYRKNGGPDRYAVMERDKFRGIPLYVVPYYCRKFS